MYGHQFDDVEDSDHSCGECGVIVHDDALEDFSLDCPTPPCSSPANRGEPCTFVPTHSSTVCSYCGAPGDPDADDSWDEDPDESWLVEVVDVAAVDELAREHGWSYTADEGDASLECMFG